MDEVQIITRSVPAKPRSKNYPTGSVASSSGGGGGNITVTGGTNVDVVKTTDTKTLTDQNVLSSLRAISEALNVFLSRVVKDKDEATEPSDEKVYSSLRTDSEIKDAVNKALESLEELYLSKVNDDTAEGLIRFLKGIIVSGTPILSNLGIKVGTFASGVSGGQIDGDGNGELLDLLLRGVLSIGNYVAGKSGARITKEGAGELLSLVLREGLQSANFSTGALGAGLCLKIDENGDSYLEVDRALFRKTATFIELLIQQLRQVGGQIIITPASMHCVKVEELEAAYRCYFENTDGEKTIEQEFVIDDLARCQTFNIKEGVHENVGNTYYWRAVVGTGDNYIDLSKTDCDTGSTVPSVGDDIVQLGNKTDATRQAAIVLSAYGNDAPYFKMYRGINSYQLDGKEFVNFSRSDVMIIADHIKFSSGESVKDYIDKAVGGVVADAEEAKQAAVEAANSAAQAATDAKEATNRLNDWAADNKISPTEKQALKDEIARIDADKTQISNGYNKYGLGLPTAFDNAYTSYRTVLVSLTATEPESIAIPSDFKTKQENYYSERTIALTKISDAAKDYAEELVGNIQVGVVNLLKGTKDLSHGTFIGDKTTNGYEGFTVIHNKYIAGSAIINVALYTNLLTPKPNTTYTLSFYCKGNGFFGSYFYPSCVASGENIDGNTTTNVDGYITTNLTSDWRRVWIKWKTKSVVSDAQSLIPIRLLVGTSEIWACGFKFEEGNIPTDWTPAPEDTSAAIQEALETAQDAQTAANNADTKASQAASRLDEWASDSVISPTEKLSLKQEQKMITAEKDTIVADAAKYGVSSTAYVNAFNAYNAELTYHTTATPENITIRSSFATNQAAYYTAYKNINSAIADAAKKFANDIAVDLDSYKKTVTAKFEQTNNSITAAVTTSKEYTNEAVSNMQVGGRNYAQKTGKEFKLTSFTNELNICTFLGYSITNLKEGDTVVTSFDYEVYGVIFNNSESLLRIEFSSQYGYGKVGWEVKENGSGHYESVPTILTNIYGGQIETSTIADLFIRADYVSGNENSYVRIWNVKVEKGNKSTDWTQAPEDIKSSIDSVNTALTTYKQETTAKLTVLEQKIALTVTSEELQQTRTEILNSAATTAQSKADAAKQAAISTAAQDATNKVNAVQVGGRNLLRNTSFSNNTSYWVGDNLSISVDSTNKYLGNNSLKIIQTTAGNESGLSVRVYSQAITKTNKASFSCYIKADKEVSIRIRLGGEQSVAKTYSVGTSWVKIKFENAYMTSDAVVFTSLSSCTWWLAVPMLVEATKATDWSPAPEDVTSDIEKAKQEAIADAAGKYVTTTTYTQKINQITADLNGVSLKASQTETKVTEIDGEITSLDKRVTASEVAVQPENIAAIVTSTVKVGGVNLLLNSYYSRSLTNTSQKDTYAYYDDLSVYLEKGKTYVLSSKTNGKWASNHNDFGKNNVTIWITKGISGTYHRVISSDSMKSDGSYGSVFTHTGETGEYVLRFNIYDAGTFWFKETKIENGTISTAYSKAPQDQYTDNSYLSRGKMLYRDPTFAEGYNSVNIYNNAGNGNVKIERVNNITGNPNTSGYCLKITTKGIASPDFGGFSFQTQTKANQILLTKIVAKIPIDRTIDFATNAIGDDNKNEWLTSNKGTGEWSEYIYRVICGSTGSFSTTNFFYLKGGTTPTEASPLVWYVSFATVYDVTGVDDTPTKDEIKTGITIEPNVINVFGKAINLTGAVTFSSLATDAQDKINTAQSTANTANTAANNAQNTANSAVSAVTASKDTIAKELGYSSFADMQAKPTIIDGGYIRTSYLDSDAIRSTIVTAEKIASLSITTGNLTVTDGAKIGNLTVKDNTLAVDADTKALVIGEIGGDGQQTYTGKYLQLGGEDVAMKISLNAVLNKSLTGLKIYSQGVNNTALNIHGQNADYAVKIFGGCNWTTNSAYKWIMPGLLWCARMSNGGTVYDQFGDACGTVTTRRTDVGKYLIQHNLGHGEYVPVVIADQGSTGNLFANVEDVQYDHFYVRIIHKDQSYKDSSFYVAILGRTKNP